MKTPVISLIFYVLLVSLMCGYAAWLSSSALELTDVWKAMLWSFPPMIVFFAALKRASRKP